VFLKVLLRISGIISEDLVRQNTKERMGEEFLGGKRSMFISHCAKEYLEHISFLRL